MICNTSPTGSSSSRRKIARSKVDCFSKLCNVPTTCSTSFLPFAKLSRPKPRNTFLFRVCAISSAFGITVLFLSAAGRGSFVQNLMIEGTRIYQEGFEGTKSLSDEATINAVQFVKSFLDDVPCENTWRSQRCYNEVVSFARKRQKSCTIVLAVTTAGKYEVALNWCASMMRLRVQNYMLIALDDESFHFFSDLGAPIVLLSGAQKTIVKNDIWVRRILLTYMILRAGMDVLVSDFDAVSVKSPFKSPLFKFEDTSLDIITTPSNFPNPTKHELPDECRRPTLWWSKQEWKYQPCMGWTFFRSSPRLISFFEETLLYDVIKFRDDQIGFNCAIRRAGAEWRDPKIGLKWKGMVTSLWSPKLTILMLPANRYVRNCTERKDKDQNLRHRKAHDQGKVEMYHCKGYNKEANARSNGFWFLRSDWSGIRSESRVFKSYLREITFPLGAL